MRLSLLINILCLVDHADAVVVEQIDLDIDGTFFRVRVAKADVGMVIGRSGRTARSH
jgi:predicted RNA-binding protein YlqC (UPF0109 family)